MKRPRASAARTSQTPRARTSQRPCKRVPVGCDESAFNLTWADADGRFIGGLLVLLCQHAHMRVPNPDTNVTLTRWGFHSALLLSHVTTYPSPICHFQEPFSTGCSDYIHHFYEKYAPNKNNWFNRTQYSYGYRNQKSKPIFYRSRKTSVWKDPENLIIASSVHHIPRTDVGTFPE